MEVIYLKSFAKDIKKLKETSLKNKLKLVLLDIESVEHVEDIKNLKKLKSYTTAYRVRIGDYRLGIYIENNSVMVARFVKRNDIYKVFP